MTIGERLLKVRKEKGLTLQYVADKVGTTKDSLSRYERDKRKPDCDMIKSLASFYNISSDYLLGIKEREKTDNKFKNINNLIKNFNNAELAELEKIIEAAAKLKEINKEGEVKK